MSPLPAVLARSLTGGSLDAQLIQMYGSPTLRKALRDHDKLDLVNFRSRVDRLMEKVVPETSVRLAPLEVHQHLVKGLPGPALFIASAMAFDSLAEALPFFECTAKTAWKKLDKRLSPAESEQALRLGRVATGAAHLLGSQEAGRQYLRTPNFALGGVMPLELLKTAEGERMVLNELQAHRDGGPL